MTGLIKADGNIDEGCAMQFAKTQMGLTIKTAFETDNRIANLLKRGELDFTNQSIDNLLFITNVSLNTKTKLSAFQAVQMREHIKATYFELTLEEIALCFRKGCMGEYGPTYNRLDLEIINGWLDKYHMSDERFDHMENRHKNAELIVSHQDIMDSFSKKPSEFVNPKAPEFFAKLSESLKAFDKGNIYAPNAKKVGSIVPHVSLGVFKQRLALQIPKMDDVSLNQLKSDYEKNKPQYYKTAIQIITKELESRKTKV